MPVLAAVSASGEVGGGSDGKLRGASRGEPQPRHAPARPPRVGARAEHIIPAGLGARARGSRPGPRRSRAAGQCNMTVLAAQPGRRAALTAGDLGVGVDGQAGIEHGVGDAVAELVCGQRARKGDSLRCRRCTARKVLRVSVRCSGLGPNRTDAAARTPFWNPRAAKEGRRGRAGCRHAAGRRQRRADVSGPALRGRSPGWPSFTLSEVKRYFFVADEAAAAMVPLRARSPRVDFGGARSDCAPGATVTAEP